MTVAIMTQTVSMARRNDVSFALNAGGESDLTLEEFHMYFGGLAGLERTFSGRSRRPRRALAG